MRRMIVRIGATGAGTLLAVGLLAGPSAGAAGSDSTSKAKGEPSEKVTCFNPEGKTQGRSLSDPDGTSNGGADKPGCTREAPWDADTDNDGNNGCGNDADREDDNNGNCGRQKAQGPSNGGREDEGDGTPVTPTETPDTVDTDGQVQAAGTVPAAGPTAAEDSATSAAPTEVSGAGTNPPAAAETNTPDTQVLGETLSAPDTLARTGAGIGGLALLGGLLVGGGRLTVLARKLLRID